MRGDGRGGAISVVHVQVARQSHVVGEGRAVKDFTVCPNPGLYVAVRVEIEGSVDSV